MILKTYTRIFTTDLESTVATLKAVHGTEPHLRLNDDPLFLVGIGDVLAIGGKDQALAPIRCTFGPWIVEDIDDAKGKLLANGAAVVRDIVNIPRTQWNHEKRRTIKMKTELKMDFISDVSCPWCIIGLRSLQAALARLDDTVDADIIFRPFELNPTMRPEGQNIVEHLAQKYGSTDAQSAAARAMIRDRAAAVGFTILNDDDGRIYNTFDAHRLLHWARTQGLQQALKEALFELYFSNRGDPSDHETLVQVAKAVGLDPIEAQAILSSDRYADDVRKEEQLWRSRGISSVPAIVVNERYLISGARSPEEFERALRDIATEAADPPIKAER